MKSSKLSDLRGIGAATAADLKRSGFLTVEDLAAAHGGELEAVKGFGPIRAAAVIGEAQALVADSGADPAAGSGKPAGGGRKSKKKGKKEKGKKGKKKKEKAEKAKGGQ